jgi:3-hydroxyisobutyrate dehydrogenase-like beta-hydroxyacid dehydrogenase
MKYRIGFVGVGLMGSSLAKHLLAAGFPVVVHDIDPVKVEAIVKQGGKKAGSPDQIAPQVDVIMLSLPSSPVVNEVVTNSLKLFETGRKGLIVIDATTADPALSTELAAQLRQKGIEMLDATISGTSDMCAIKDTLFMVGGKEEIFKQCEPLFAAMSREWIFMGENGKGAVIKLVVNLVLSLNRMALAEGLTLAKKAGLDQLQTLEVLKKSAAFSKIMDQKGYRMVKKQFLPPAGHLAIHYKDVRLMLALGAKLDCPLPLLSLDAQALASEICKGRGEWDSSDIISFYNELANI